MTQLVTTKRSLPDFPSVSGSGIVLSGARNVSTSFALAGREIQKSDVVNLHEAPSLAGLLTGFRLDLSELSMHFAGETRLSLLKQIKLLLDLDEWDEDDAFPERGSFKTLLRAMLILSPNARAGLGANGKGSLTAAWTSGRNRLTLDCYGSDRITWLLTREQINGLVERAAGETKVSRLWAVLSPYKPEIWFPK